MPTLNVQVIGSGIAGLCCAYLLQQQNDINVTLTTASKAPDADCCSWWAGGMLAPFCEQETAEPLIEKLGKRSIAFWREFNQKHPIDYQHNGTLVLTPPRDSSLLATFAQKTAHYQKINATQIAQLEPDLSHFSAGLFFADEAHITPRKALSALWKTIKDTNITIQTQQTIDPDSTINQYDWQIDCRGLQAQDTLTELRGVKGEMLHVHCPDVQLQRPVRLLHPRYPIYIVPRGNQQFMIGATMIEVNQNKRASVRSLLELLSSAYTLHPSFAEAEVIEIGVDFRPAFNNNLPQIHQYHRRICVNGLYRHGYLAAPALAEKITNLIAHNASCSEVIHENHA